MVRSGLRQLLKIDQAFDLLPIDADIGDGLPHLCQTLSPDVLLIEVATNNSSALRVPADLLASVPHVRILFISTNENAAYVRTVFATGVLVTSSSLPLNRNSSRQSSKSTEAGDL